MNLDERLAKFPKLRSRMEKILGIAENKDGDILLADDAEDRVTEELQRLGQEVLQGWAEHENERQGELTQAHDARAHSHGKKNSIGTRNMAK